MGNPRGFTLIELLIVVAIIGLLAAVAVPLFADALRSAKQAAIETEAAVLYGAFIKYYVDNGWFPSTSSPADRTLNRTTLFPLSNNGYFTNGISLTGKLEAGQITAYDSPNVSGADTQFWAVLTLGADTSINLLVAHTNDYPDHEGTWFDGVYLISGSSIVIIGED